MSKKKEEIKEITTINPHQEWKKSGDKPKKVKIIHKDTFPHIQLPKYIQDSLETYGNSVVGDKVYQKLGIEGVEDNVFENFGRRVECTIGEYGDCLITLKNKRTLHRARLKDPTYTNE